MALLFADAFFQEHETGNHPESPKRLEAIYRALEGSDLKERFVKGDLVSANPEQLTAVHEADYLETVREFAEQGGGHIEADTVVSRRSYEVALKAAGCAVESVDQVLSGKVDRSVCLTRPPGHHALPDSAMGFCLINNVAVAARHAHQAHGLSRILIVDWDVHHGNGTQDIFYEDEHVYFFSAHRYPFYPGTGSEKETGGGKGRGTIFNLPLAFGISRKEYRERFAKMLEEAAGKCHPELVFISAGFDAHAADPIGSLGLESEDFGDLTRMVTSVADQYCEGRVVSLLEGGYNLQALAESVLVHLETLVPEKL